LLWIRGIGDGLREQTLHAKRHVHMDLKIKGWLHRVRMGKFSKIWEPQKSEASREIDRTSKQYRLVIKRRR
jgi:hypothetical protein